MQLRPHLYAREGDGKVRAVGDTWLRALVSQCVPYLEGFQGKQVHITRETWISQVANP